MLLLPMDKRLASASSASGATVDRESSDGHYFGTASK